MWRPLCPPHRDGYRSPLVLGYIAGRASGQFKIFNGNIVREGIPGFGLCQNPNPHSVGCGTRGVFDHPLFQANGLIGPVFEIEVRIVGLAFQGPGKDFIQIT